MPGKERTRFLHAALFSPPISTTRKVLRNGHLKTWPHIETKCLNKNNENTLLGRLDAARRKSKKTSVSNSKDKEEEEEEEIIQEEKTNLFIRKVIELDETSCSNQTGKFPCVSSRGNRYLMVVHSCNANGILLRAIKNRTGDELRTTLESVFDCLTERGFKPKFHMMDKEAAIKTINMIKRQKINLQLAPPDLHRRSPAERAIRTAKNHLLSGLARMRDKFPAHLWCRLIQQAEMMLNMLRPCGTNPKLSAHAALEGEFNFERTPLAPPGMKVIMHKKPGKRSTWSYYGKIGWCIGPEMLHCKCIKCCVPDAGGTITAETFSCTQDNKFRIPKVAPQEEL